MAKVMTAHIDFIPEEFYKKEAKVRAKCLMRTIDKIVEREGRPELRDILLAKAIADEEKRLASFESL